MVGMQTSKSLSQIFGMNNLVRSAFVLHFPSHGGGWRWTDEEKLIALRERKVLVANVQRCVHSEVDADPATHHCFPVKALADGDGGLGVKEGDNYAAEGLQRGPGMDWGALVD